MKEKIRKLITTYHDVPIQMKASLWFVLSTVLLKGISFITVPILRALWIPINMVFIVLFDMVRNFYNYRNVRI